MAVVEADGDDDVLRIQVTNVAQGEDQRHNLMTVEEMVSSGALLSVLPDGEDLDSEEVGEPVLDMDQLLPRSRLHVGSAQLVTDPLSDGLTLICGEIRRCF